MARPAGRILRATCLGALLLLPAGCDSSGLRDGPLDVAVNPDAVHGYEAVVGQPFAFGFNILRNTGHGPISNLTATLVPETEGTVQDFTFEPAQVVEMDAAQTGYLGGGAWPDPDFAKYAKPLQGYVLPASSGQVDLLFVMRVDGKGEWFWPKARVEYDYDGGHFVEEAGNRYSVCAPRPCEPRRS